MPRHTALPSAHVTTVHEWSTIYSKQIQT